MDVKSRRVFLSQLEPQVHKLGCDAFRHVQVKCRISNFSQIKAFGGILAVKKILITEECLRKAVPKCILFALAAQLRLLLGRSARRSG